MVFFRSGVFKTLKTISSSERLRLINRFGCSAIGLITVNSRDFLYNSISSERFIIRSPSIGLAAGHLSSFPAYSPRLRYHFSHDAVRKYTEVAMSTFRFGFSNRVLRPGEPAQTVAY
ncbi:hypothetical protein U1Q18_051852 [Sarracenia purpurea var. burkii]